MTYYEALGFFQVYKRFECPHMMLHVSFRNPSIDVYCILLKGIIIVLKVHGCWQFGLLFFFE